MHSARHEEARAQLGLSIAVSVAALSLLLWSAVWNLPSLGVSVPLWLLTDVEVHSLRVVPGVDLLLPVAVAIVIIAAASLTRRGAQVSYAFLGIAAAYILFAPLLFLPALVLGGHIPWQPFVGSRLVPWLTVRYLGFVFVLFSAVLLFLRGSRRRHRHA